MDALSQNKEEYPLGSARPFFEKKAGWITEEKVIQPTFFLGKRTQRTVPYAVHEGICNCIDIAQDLLYPIIEVVFMASINMSIRTDSELKAQAEAVLSQLGMTMNGTINMFLHQIVREKAVPLNLSLSSEQSVYADLLYAQTERAGGYQGRNARDLLADMDQMITAAEEKAV